MGGRMPSRRTEPPFRSVGTTRLHRCDLSHFAEFGKGAVRTGAGNRTDTFV